MSSAKRSDECRGAAQLDADTIEALLALGAGEAPTGVSLAPVHELIAEVAKTSPDSIAVKALGQTMTYAQLSSAVQRLSRRLRQAGISSGARVAVMLEPSTASVIAVLGVLNAGAAYVPIDAANPAKRIHEILADAHVAGVVVDDAARARTSGLDIALFSAVDDGAIDERAIDEGEADVPAGKDVLASNAAYLIYTSGSSGTPKGVVVQHRQLAASTHARRLVYPGAARFLLLSPLAFDSSVAGLFGTLSSGGCLIVATAEDLRDPNRLVQLIKGHEVSQLLCVPALYGLILDAAARQGAACLSSLQTVIVAGDVLPRELVDRHFVFHQRPVRLVNEYGPTEATVWSSYHSFETTGSVTIGRPIPGARLYVLDDQLRPVPLGHEGELFVGGAGVAQGYFGQPEATARAFVADPFANEPAARMYRTGDHVRWTADGSLEFIGRRDHQVKIRGHRVELGAVEAAMRSISGVRQVVVVADRARTSLAAFVEASLGVTADAVRESASQLLPPAMLPARIRVLERLPLTINGKFDRRSLEAEAECGGPVSAVRVPATSGPGVDDDTTAQVAAAWGELLQLRTVPTDVNFFDLGGHSLLTFKLQDTLERHTGRRPPLVALFRHTTIRAQAALIRSDRSDTGEMAMEGRLHDARRARAQRAQRQRIDRRETE